ncbi:MAG: NYN domain-containing protein [Oscillospiraceae bacterium]
MKRLTVGILAHVDAGKTTLSESMLYLTGTIRKLGRVDHRNTFLDTHTLERERGITIFSKQARLSTGDMEITLLDTPGHADFSGETERTLPVLDYAILVISGTDGVQAHTETLWALLERYHVPTFVFVTKMDASHHTQAELMDDLQAHLSDRCLDLRERDDETLAMLDEGLLDRYMDTGTVTDGDITALIQNRRLFPVCFGSGLRLTGVPEFLETLARFTTEPAYPEAFGALVYKIARDLQGTRLTYLKVTGGSLSVRDTIRCRTAAGEEIEEKAAQLRLYSGQKFETASTVPAGCICAVTGLTGTWPGQGLGAQEDALSPLLIPALSYRLTLPKGVEARTMLPKLRELEEEEPLLRVVWQEQLSEIQLQLMGAVQIEVVKSLIRERFDVDVQIGSGRILYRETIADTVEGVGHFEPLRHYAEVHLLIEPGERGSGILCRSALSEDVLDLSWQRLILTHLEEKQHLGVLTGAPLTDVVITLIAGRAHLKHTEGGDFRQAAYRAVRQGLMQAQSVLLEPYYAFRLEVPAEHIGRAISDIHAMGGEHGSPETLGDRMVISGTAPVSAMAEYGAEVAAYTRGRGRFSVRVEGYRPCRNQDAVVAELGYDPEADTANTPDSVFCAHGAGFNVKWRDVPEYMHLDSGLKRAADPVPEVRIRPHSLDIDERELEAIMEREFGPIRRKVYSAPTVNSAIGVEYQARKKPERIIVDGYNVIFAWDELKALAEKNIDSARARLIDLLASYRGYTKSELVLVFDAYRVPAGQGSKYDDAKLHIAYTKEGETADMYIERLVADIGKNESVRVITSDRLIRLSAMRTGVRLTSSKEFEAEVAWVMEQIDAIVKKSQE